MLIGHWNHLCHSNIPDNVSILRDWPLEVGGVCRRRVGEDVKWHPLFGSPGWTAAILSLHITMVTTTLSSPHSSLFFLSMQELFSDQRDHIRMTEGIYNLFPADFPTFPGFCKTLMMTHWTHTVHHIKQIFWWNLWDRQTEVRFSIRNVWSWLCARLIDIRRNCQDFVQSWRWFWTI